MVGKRREAVPDGRHRHQVVLLRVHVHACRDAAAHGGILLLPVRNGVEAVAHGGVGLRRRVRVGRAVVFEIIGRHVLRGALAEVEAEHAFRLSPGVAVGTEARARADVAVGGGIRHVAARLVELIVELQAEIALCGGDVLNRPVGIGAELLLRECLRPHAELVDLSVHRCAARADAELRECGQRGVPEVF